MELLEAAKKFLEIDDKIHSRSEFAQANEIIADADTYTWARKALVLAIRAASKKKEEV